MCWERDPVGRCACLRVDRLRPSEERRALVCERAVRAADSLDELCGVGAHVGRARGGERGGKGRCLRGRRRVEPVDPGGEDELESTQVALELLINVDAELRQPRLAEDIGLLDDDKTRRL